MPIGTKRPIEEGVQGVVQYETAWGGPTGLTFWTLGVTEGGFMLRAAIYVAILSVAGAASAEAQDAKAQGARVFADQKCSVCHSIAGKGNSKGPLDDIGKKDSSDEIRAWITDAKGMTAKTKAARKPEMKAYTLPKEDVDELVAYLTAMKKK